MNKTAEEAKCTNVAAMGEALGELYSELWQSLAATYKFWNEYVVLFGTSPERVEILNKAAPEFFRMLQDEFWETTLLHLARLTDPAISPGGKGRENLTIQALPRLISDVKLKGEVNVLVMEAVRRTEFCRDWRNRRIAHHDLKLALAQPALPLAEGSRLRAKEALKAIADILNAVCSHYFESETRFDLVGSLGGALSLVQIVEEGLAARELKRGGHYLNVLHEDDLI